MKPKHRSTQWTRSPIPKNQHPHLTILPSTRDRPIAQPTTRNGARMARKSPLALARPGIPDLHHAVLGAADEA